MTLLRFPPKPQVKEDTLSIFVYEEKAHQIKRLCDAFIDGSLSIKEFKDRVIHAMNE